MEQTGRPRLSETPAAKLKFKPIILKELSLACGITQGDLAKATQTSRPTICSCFNRGYVPPTVPGFARTIEAIVAGHPTAPAWLEEQGLQLADIWHPAGKNMKGQHVKGLSQRTREGKAKPRPMAPGNPERIDIKEVEMINPEALRHFKLFRNPFLNDIQTAEDIYMSDEHRYLEMAMLDSARYNGMMAIVGQVGSGKSTIRKKIIEQLRKEGDIHVVFPQILDKDKINSGTLCDAIIMDISDQRPKVKHEHKARQVRQLLLDRCQGGARCCLIIEEAHMLTVPAFKTIKQLHELEDGFRKLLGVILIGQTELGDKLNEQYHPEMREVIRRIQIAKINGLDKNLPSYLEKKFKRVGCKDLGSIIDEGGLEMLSRRLTGSDAQGKPLSNAYPLTVNLYITRAMNLAQEMGFDLVTAEVVEAI